MFDNTNREEMNYNNNQTGQQPYLHRSSSAPAIAEHVSDAILPSYNYDVCSNLAMQTAIVH
jgi:hypothetical protein